jgi:hypothetical protein
MAESSMAIMERALRAEQERDQARALLQKIRVHLDDLADAFRRGALTDREWSAARSNTNQDLLREVEGFLGGRE